MTVQTFEVEAAEDIDSKLGHYYLIRVAAEDWVRYTESETEGGVHGMAADLLSLMLEVPIDQIAVAVSFYEKVPPEWNLD